MIKRYGRTSRAGAGGPVYGCASDMGALRLWKLNERSGLWDYQRSVTPETADEWRRRFQIDEPKATFAVSKNRPIPPALRKGGR